MQKVTAISLFLLGFAAISFAVAEDHPAKNAKTSEKREIRDDRNAGTSEKKIGAKRRSKNRLACSVPTGCGEDLCSPCPKN
jgi:hypothetical protein